MNKCAKCGWTWNYKGNKTVYAICPNCRKIVPLIGDKNGTKENKRIK